MSKTVILIRHATAEDGSHSQMFKDIDRELTSKGIMEAAKMGAFLKSLKTPIDVIYCSPAKRTQLTANLIAEQLGIADHVKVTESLYGGGPRGYLSTINTVDGKSETICVVGHNPDITFFSEYLTRDDVGGSFEKGTAVALILKENMNWNELSAKSMDFKWRKSIADLNE